MEEEEEEEEEEEKPEEERWKNERKSFLLRVGSFCFGTSLIIYEYE